MNAAALTKSFSAILRIPVEFDLRPEWGSEHQNHRAGIREEIIRRFARDQALLEDLRDLKSVPRLQGLALSISHCVSCGGFAASARAGRLGMDIESRSRVTDRTVLRMSDEAQLKSASESGAGSAGLWAAKEAVYKALPPAEQPPLLSAIRINPWHAQDSGWSFGAEGRPGRGHLEITGDWVIAVYVE